MDDKPTNPIATEIEQLRMHAAWTLEIAATGLAMQRALADVLSKILAREGNEDLRVEFEDAVSTSYVAALSLIEQIKAGRRDHHPN